MTSATATETERKIAADLLGLFDEAKGDHSALADVRRQISEQIDSFLVELAARGVDTEALMDELDEELGR